MRHTSAARFRALLLVALYAAGSFGIPGIDALVFHSGKFTPRPLTTVTAPDHTSGHDQSCLLGYTPAATASAATVDAPDCRTAAPERQLKTPTPATPASAPLPTPHQPRAPPAPLA
ncbi:MAG: hypothetical protein ACREOE_12370 [Gemmatimonadales bacterium]